MPQGKGPFALALVWGIFLWAVAITARAEVPRGYYLGADLSYVNEMEDCGVVYRDSGTPADPFALLQSRGANLMGGGRPAVSEPQRSERRCHHDREQPCGVLEP